MFFGICLINCSDEERVWSVCHALAQASARATNRETVANLLVTGRGVLTEVLGRRVGQ
jgi:hypothetical protein